MSTHAHNGTITYGSNTKSEREDEGFDSRWGVGGGLTSWKETALGGQLMGDIKSIRFQIISPLKSRSTNTRLIHVLDGRTGHRTECSLASAPVSD